MFIDSPRNLGVSHSVSLFVGAEKFCALCRAREARGDDSGESIGDPGRARTCNPRSRNPLLYPVELRDRPGRTLKRGPAELLARQL